MTKITYQQLKVATYARTANARDDTGALSRQQQRLREYCAEWGWRIEAEYAEKAGSHQPKPQLQQALDDGSNGLFKTLVLCSVDRLSRDRAELRPIVDQWHSHGLKIHVVEFESNLDIEQADLMFAITQRMLDRLEKQVVRRQRKY